MPGEKKYRLCVTFTQETDGDIDNRTLCEEYSQDVNVHIAKTSVWTRWLTEAVNGATQEMIASALSQGGGKPGNRPG